MRDAGCGMRDAGKTPHVVAEATQSDRFFPTTSPGGGFGSAYALQLAGKVIIEHPIKHETRNNGSLCGAATGGM